MSVFMYYYAVPEMWVIDNTIIGSGENLPPLLNFANTPQYVVNATQQEQHLPTPLPTFNTAFNNWTAAEEPVIPMETEMDWTEEGSEMQRISPIGDPMWAMDRIREWLAENRDWVPVPQESSAMSEEPADWVEKTEIMRSLPNPPLLEEVEFIISRSLLDSPTSPQPSIKKEEEQEEVEFLVSRNFSDSPASPQTFVKEEEEEEEEDMTPFPLCKSPIKQEEEDIEEEEEEEADENEGGEEQMEEEEGERRGEEEEDDDDNDNDYDSGYSDAETVRLAPSPPPPQEIEEEEEEENPRLSVSRLIQRYELTRQYYECEASIIRLQRRRDLRRLKRRISRAKATLLNHPRRHINFTKPCRGVDICHICGKSYYSQVTHLWEKCEECSRWTCPKCLLNRKCRE